MSTANERRTPPYIRVKRRNQTVFVDALPSDTFLRIKERLAAVFAPLTPAQIQLWSGLAPKEATAKELPDVSTLADHDVLHDSVIYMCWKKDNSDQWEELSITPLETPTEAKPE